MTDRLRDVPPTDAPVPRFLWLVVVLGATVAVAALARGGGSAGSDLAAPPSDFTARVAGAALFARSGCADCHDPTGVDSAVGPGLLGMAARAELRITSPDYGGDATTVDGYLEEAILDHCLDPLPDYDCTGAPDLAMTLSLAEIAQLAAYLRELPSGAAP